MKVNAICLFCEATITGERDYMLRGIGLRMDGRRKPAWLKALPEFKWAWNGLMDFVKDERVEFNFYLCPQHTNRDDYDKAFNWAQTEIDNAKRKNRKDEKTRFN